MARILIITPKQPSGNPRMRKSADALSMAGHEVHVLYAYGAPWADEADVPILASANWSFEVIGGHPIKARFAYFISRLERKFYEVLGNTERATCRSLNQYVRKAENWNPEVVIGHNPGALAPAIEIGKQLHIPVLFDAEDYHRGESYWVRVKQEHKMTEIEDRYMPQLTAMTTAAPLISDTYRSLYPNLDVTTVNNAFSKRNQPAAPQSTTGPLKVVWFSQVVGLDRGLQEFIAGMNLVKDIPLELNILGLSTTEKNEMLTSMVESPEHRIAFHSPRSEAELFSFLGSHEIGLALEIPFAHNREICRTNKLYTYPLAGCYMFASRTQSQEQFISEYPVTGQLIDLDEPRSIGTAIREADSNRKELLRKREQTWQLAIDDLNWETESQVLVNVVEGVIAKNQ